MPISIDGDDVSEISVDGDDVAEVTVDGDVVWPDVTEIDTFDAEDLSPYFSSTGSFGFVSDPSRSGAALECTDGGVVQLRSNEGDGLPNYPANGDTWEWWVSTSSVTAGETAGMRFGFADASNRHEARIRWGEPDILLNTQTGGSFVNSQNAGFSASPDTWYKNVLTWGSPTITHSLEDASGAQLASVSYDNSDHQGTANISFMAGGSAATSYFDEAVITTGGGNGGGGGALTSEDFGSGYAADFFSETFEQGTHDQSVADLSRADVLRVDLDDGNHYGMDARYEPTEFNDSASKPLEMWVEYEVYVPDGYDILPGGQKMPGIADTTGGAGWGSRIPGEDGDGWSARGLIALDPDVVYGYYVYSYDMTANSVGDSFSGAAITTNAWHTIREHVSMNDIGSQNGELDMWVDGAQVIDLGDKEFRQDTSIAINSLWFDVYHGGDDPSPQDQSVYFDNATVYDEDPGW